MAENDEIVWSKGDKYKNITVGTSVGSTDWSYVNVFPLGSPHQTANNIHMLPTKKNESDFPSGLEGSAEFAAYLASEAKYYMYDAGIDWEMKEASDMTLISLVSAPKIGILKTTGVDDYQMSPKCNINGLIRDFDRDVLLNYCTLSGGYNDVRGRVVIDPLNSNSASIINESYRWWYGDGMLQPTLDGWLYNLPYFETVESLEAYLQSMDPDWTHFGGKGIEQRDPYDPGGDDQFSDDIIGTWENLGISTSTGPVRVAVISEAELTHLAEALKGGWLAGNIGEGIISIKYMRTPMEISAGNEMGIIDTKGIVTNQIIGKFVRHQFQSVTMGHIKIGEKFGDFTDYTNARIELYLPFLGNQQLDIKSIINNDCILVAGFDFLTGSVIYQLEIIQENGVKQVLYYWASGCSIEIPLSAVDYGSKISAWLSGIMQIGASAVTGFYPGVVSGAGTIASTISDSHITTSNLSSNFGWGNIMTPYVSIYYSKIPSVDYTSVIGLPCHKMLKLSNLKGYTKISNINLDGLDCLDEEREDIISRMVEGIRF